MTLNKFCVLLVILLLYFLLLQRTNALQKIFDILGFLSFLYLLHLIQQGFFRFIFLESIYIRNFQFEVIEETSILFYHFFHIHEEKINCYNPTEFQLLAFILIFLLPMIILIFFNIFNCKAIKICFIITIYIYNVVQQVSIDFHTSKFIRYDRSFILG